MNPRLFLRVEGLAALTLAPGGWMTLNGPIWLLVVLALTPDLSMLRHLAGPRLGSLSYNVEASFGVLKFRTMLFRHRFPHYSSPESTGS